MTTQARALRRVEVPGPGAEDVLIDESGAAWTGTADGRVFRISGDGTVRQVGRTGGRPLGLELLDAARILVCDAQLGLLAMSRTTGVVERLATEVDGRAMRFCNNAAVAGNGDVWFTDSSTRYGIEQWKHDLVERTASGRLLCRRADGTLEVHLAGLDFANGVALASDESFVCVAETGARRVTRLWLRGPRAGSHEVYVADLPAYPDNISRGSDGLIWVTLASPRDAVLELIRHRLPPVLRRVLSRLPQRVQPGIRRTVRVQAYDDEGALVHDLSADASHYHAVTGVREHHGQVWLASLEEPALAVLSPGSPA